MSKVFISHATKDKPIVDLFVDDLLIGVMQLKVGDIFYTSGYGTKIKSGEDWRTAIKSSLLKSEIIFLFISPYYKESEMCLCEMGAAWATNKTVIPLIIPPINYKTVGVIYEPVQIEQILNEDALERIKDLIQLSFEIPVADIKSDRWNAKKRQFLIEAKDYLTKKPYPSPVTKDIFDEIVKENKELNSSFKELTQELKGVKALNTELEKAKDAKEVKAIKNKFNPSSEYEDFEDLCAKISNEFKFLSPIVRGIVFKTFNSKSLQFDWGAYRSDIEDADAENFVSIDEDDGTVKADWNTTKTMRKVYSLLNELDRFIEKPPSETFDEEYEKNYDAPLKIDNKSFWDEAFNLPIILN